MKPDMERFYEVFRTELQRAFNTGWEAAEWSANVPPHNPADTRERRMKDDFRRLLDISLTPEEPKP